MNKIQLGDSPYYVNPQFIVSTLKKEFTNRILYKASFNDLYVDQSKEYGEVLYERVENHYGKEMDPNLITNDPSIINLYKAIKILDKVL